MSVVDTVRTVETPEGVELHLRPAGPVARGLALLVDQAVIWGGLVAVLAVLALLGEAGFGIWLILLFFTQWLYPVAFEVLGSGRTLGKRMMHLRVLKADGTPVDWGTSLLRNLLRFVDGLPFGYTVGLIAVLLTRDFQRVGDLVAGTLVVHEPEPSRKHLLTEGEAVAPPPGLTVDEQACLLAFGERSGTLTAARAQELGDLLAEVTGARGEDGVRALQGMARHIRGGR
ncbi:MAG TPA: RDD family protein [Holophagaceae bacterium]|nr:RDD family protein [Holophagaceae bacterium]